MKKTLIALSLAALSTAAVADVTLYGQIKAGVEISRTKVKAGGVSAKSHTTTQIADFGSRIGFKGHESIGNNLNAIWQIENKTSVAGNNSGWSNRESFIGLEGDFGKFRAGNLNTQLDNMGNLDPWEYDNQALGLKTFQRTDERVVSARYDTPVFGGFSANVQFTPRDNQADSGRATPLSDTSAYYAGLNYENAGFFAQYGLAYKKSAYVGVGKTGDSKSAQAHRVIAGYDANNLFVGAGYQFTNGWDTLNSYKATQNGGNAYGIDAKGDIVASKYNAAADGSQRIKTHELALTGAYRFGNVTPRLSYVHGFQAKGKGLSADEKKSVKYNQVVLGADYDFSKRTTAFAQAGWLKSGSGNNKADTTGGLVGLRHKF